MARTALNVNDSILAGVVTAKNMDELDYDSWATARTSLPTNLVDYHQHSFSTPNASPQVQARGLAFSIYPGKYFKGIP